MKSKHHFITPLLMLTSLALLSGFLGLWLHKSYQEEKQRLQKRTGELLEETVRIMFDSLSLGKLRKELLLSDTTRLNIKVSTQVSGLNWREGASPYSGTKHRKEMLQILNPPDSAFFVAMEKESRRKDSTVVHGYFYSQLSASDSMISVCPDSLPPFGQDIEKLFLSIDRAPTGVRLLFGMARDTLPFGEVKALFGQALERESMPLPFDLLKVGTPETGLPLSGLSTDPVAANLLSGDRFLAYFPRYRGFLLQRLGPQIIFSLLLFGITALAFALMQRSLRQQRRLTTMKNDFLSNVTHELKTPITSVSVAIEALSNFGALKDPKLTQEYLDISRQELKRLSMLVDKVLKMAVFEQREPELHPESFDLGVLLEQIVRAMRLQFEKHGAEVSLDLRGEDFQLSADRTHLTSVVYNLLDNALKYSNDHARVGVELTDSGSYLQVRVSDQGIGIPAEYQNRVFDKFFRVPAGDVHNTKGYGLGLSYVAAVVRKHGGKIRLDSEPGHGTTFIITLPKQGKA